MPSVSPLQHRTNDPRPPLRAGEFMGNLGAIRSIFSTCNALGQDGLPTLGMVQKRPFSETVASFLVDSAVR